MGWFGRGKENSKVLGSTETVAYDYEAEEELISDGDFEGWLTHISERPLDGFIFGHRDIAHIAQSVYRIMENKK